MMNGNDGTLIISLDFELVWGVRDFAGQEKLKKILITRQMVPRLLNLFEEFEIHATWATVGFLFFGTRDELLASLPYQKPGYTNRSLSPYKNLTTELGANERVDPYHFAPSLIQQIIQTPHQEIATHTFSHYYCLEEGQSVDEFEQDLWAALKAAQKFERNLVSIVFPRNQYNPSCLDVCARNGVLAYRGTENLWFRQSSKRRMHRQLSRRIMRIVDAYFNISGTNAYPLPSRGSPPINLPASRYLRPFSKKLGVFEPLRLRRITDAMTEAARSGYIFHLWWHPEDFCTNTDENLKFLREILSHYLGVKHAYGMKSCTMQEVTQEVIRSGGK